MIFQNYRSTVSVTISIDGRAAAAAAACVCVQHSNEYFISISISDHENKNSSLPESVPSSSSSGEWWKREKKNNRVKMPQLQMNYWFFLVPECDCIKHEWADVWVCMCVLDFQIDFQRHISFQQLPTKRTTIRTIFRKSSTHMKRMDIEIEIRVIWINEQEITRIV